MLPSTQILPCNSGNTQFCHPQDQVAEEFGSEQTEEDLVPTLKNLMLAVKIPYSVGYRKLCLIPSKLCSLSLQ